MTGGDVTRPEGGEQLPTPKERGETSENRQLDPHSITIAGLTVAPDGRIPRLREETRTVGQITVDGHALPVTETTLGELEGLPEPTDGVVYVVSRMVAEAAPRRHDLYFPGGLVRDSEGRIIGAESLARLPARDEALSGA